MGKLWERLWHHFQCIMWQIKPPRVYIADDKCTDAIVSYDLLQSDGAGNSDLAFPTHISIAKDLMRRGYVGKGIYTPV